MEPLTIKDIAREAGYAVGTVSRALNDHPNVSPVAREKILEIVRRHGFQPNAHARRLKQQAGEEVVLDHSLLTKLSALTPEERERVAAFAEELIAARPEPPFAHGKERNVAEDVNL